LVRIRIGDLTSADSSRDRATDRDGSVLSDEKDIATLSIPDWSSAKTMLMRTNKFLADVKRKAARPVLHRTRLALASDTDLPPLPTVNQHQPRILGDFPPFGC